MEFQPYTYLIHCIPTNQFYYGVRYGNIKYSRKAEDDLWIHYFTSSLKIKKLRTLYGNKAFNFEIRRYFKNREEACDWEARVLTRLKVLNFPEVWLNENIGGIKFRSTPEGIAKSAAKRRGRPGWRVTSELKEKRQKEKLEKISKGISVRHAIQGRQKTASHKQALSASLLGHKRSKESIAKQKATKALNPQIISISHKAAIVASNRTRIQRPESKIKATATRKANGFTISQETRNKMSVTRKGRKRSAETTKKILETKKRKRLLIILQNQTNH